MKEEKGPPVPSDIEPLPACGISRVLGLLETLDDRGAASASATSPGTCTSSSASCCRS